MRINGRYRWRRGASTQDESPSHRTIRGYLAFIIEVSLGLGIAAALLAILYYATDPQVLFLRELFR